MNEQLWMELREDAPHAVGACLLYLQDRYPGQWRQKLTHPPTIIAYLRTQACDIKVVQFNLPNRHDWYYETYQDGHLRHQARGFRSYQQAAAAAIYNAFIQLEA